MAQAAAALAGREAEQANAMARLRQTMVDRQLRPYDVTDVPLLERFLSVPREAFLPSGQIALAYSDLAIVVKGTGSRRRSLLPPLVLARLLQGGEPRPGERALDIGGAGYSAALLSGLVGEVVALENDPKLAARAQAGLSAVGAGTARVETGPLEKGFAAGAPYDVIYVHGAVEDGLDSLFSQLTPNGRLLAIVTPEPGAGQQIVRFERHDGRAAGERRLLSVNCPVLEGFENAPAFAF
jgi:protein-L-isoaspartate(D-aspartate) O-methyltransferase